MPGSFSFVYHADQVARDRYQIMGTNLCLRIGQPRNGRLKGLHACIMQNKHIDHLPFSAVMIWGRMINKIHAENLMLVALVLEDAAAIG